MGDRRGRPAMPDELKRLRGTDQPCRMSGDSDLEGLNYLDKVASPAWLTTEGKRIFRAKSRQLSALRMLTDMDIDQLAIYASSYAMVMEAIEALQKEGAVIVSETENGVRREANPYNKIYHDNIKVVNQIGSQFGFTPVSHVTIISKLPGKPSATKNDFDDFI